MRTHGWVSRPDRHRSNLAGVYLFVNGRPVRDRVLQHALVDCYRDVLPRGRFPSAVLFVDLPLEAVDVNVHPAKWEVRFADPRAAHRWIADAVRSGLAGRALARGRAAPPPCAREPLTRPPRAASARGRRATRASRSAAKPSEDRQTGCSRDRAASPARQRTPQTRACASASCACSGSCSRPICWSRASRTSCSSTSTPRTSACSTSSCARRWLAHGVERQALLAPLAVQLEPRALAVLAERADDAARLGFEIEPFGDDTLAVRAVPALLAGRDPAGLVRGLADAWLAGEGAAGRPSDVRALDAADRIFATLACHAARRKGDPLDPREQRALLDALDAIPWAPTCPHGRPVVVPFTGPEIERRFGRR